MGTLQLILQKYNVWRRRTLPQSADDAQWRHREIVALLTEIQKLLGKQMAEEITNADITQTHVRSFLRLLEPQKVVGFSKTRVGSAGDGGYVQIDDLAGITRAFSFGISDNDSWDLQMAQAGLAVEQFDYSVDRAPSSHPLLRFHRKMISSKAGEGIATLPDLVREYSKSESPDLFLKIDIEGAEWDVFDTAPDDVISRHTQIVCEFHDLTKIGEPVFYEKANRVFEKLRMHFAVVHVHGNNFGSMKLVANVPVPDVLEVSFANRARYTFLPNDEVFPTPLDAPNCPVIPDYVLGSFRF